MQPNWAMYTLVINKTAYVLYSLFVTQDYYTCIIVTVDLVLQLS